jgi:hypothetical protein
MPAVAFVLLENAQDPDPAALVRAAAKFGYSLVHEPGSAGPSTFAIEGGGSLMIMLIAAPHPDADEMAPGLAAPSAEDLQRMRAHYIIALMGAPTGPREEDTMLAQLTAATVRASPAIAAMLGHGICFHRAAFFADMVEADPAGLPLIVCVDITRAPEPGDRMSFLTHGMIRYGREEFFVTASQRGKGALDFLLGLMNWMIADKDKHLPTGDTVGRTADERVVVQRVPNPLGEGPEVIRLDLDL